MAYTVENFKIRNPEFGDVLDQRVQLFLDEAALQVSADAWGTKYDLGVMALAAHLLKMKTEEEAGRDTRPVSSESVGSISVSYVNASDAGDSLLAQTTYGRDYQRLRRQIFASRVI